MIKWRGRAREQAWRCVKRIQIIFKRYFAPLDVTDKSSSGQIFLFLSGWMGLRDRKERRLSAVQADLDDMPSSFSEMLLQTEGSFPCWKKMFFFNLFLVLFGMATVHKAGRHWSHWLYESHFYAERKHNCLLVVGLGFNKNIEGYNSNNSLLNNNAELGLFSACHLSLQKPENSFEAYSRNVKEIFRAGEMVCSAAVWSCKENTIQLACSSQLLTLPLPLSCLMVVDSPLMSLWLCFPTFKTGEMVLFPLWNALRSILYHSKNYQE